MTVEGLDHGRHRATHRGHLEVIVGSMFSGKSEELIRRARRAEIAKQSVAMFKPSIDHRYGQGTINSHSQLSKPAVEIEHAHQIVELLSANTKVLGIDEGQFLDEEIVEIVNYYADNGVRVIVAGLDTDFRGEPFGSIPILIAQADLVDKLHAICMECGEDASRTQRMIREKLASGEWITRPADYSEPLIVVAADISHGKQEETRIEYYEARCRHCHDVPGKPEKTN